MVTRYYIYVVATFDITCLGTLFFILMQQKGDTLWKLLFTQVRTRVLCVVRMLTPRALHDTTGHSIYAYRMPGLHSFDGTLIFLWSSRPAVAVSPSKNGVGHVPIVGERWPAEQVPCYLLCFELTGTHR